MNEISENEINKRFWNAFKYETPWHLKILWILVGTLIGLACIYLGLVLIQGIRGGML